MTVSYSLSRSLQMSGENGDWTMTLDLGGEDVKEKRGRVEGRQDVANEGLEVVRDKLDSMRSYFQGLVQMVVRESMEVQFEGQTSASVSFSDEGGNIAVRVVDSKKKSLREYNPSGFERLTNEVRVLDAIDLLNQDKVDEFVNFAQDYPGILATAKMRRALEDFCSKIGVEDAKKIIDLSNGNNALWQTVPFARFNDASFSKEDFGLLLEYLVNGWCGQVTPENMKNVLRDFLNFYMRRFPESDKLDVLEKFVDGL